MGVACELTGAEFKQTNQCYLMTNSYVYLEVANSYNSYELTCTI